MLAISFIIHICFCFICLFFITIECILSSSQTERYFILNLFKIIFLIYLYYILLWYILNNDHIYNPIIIEKEKQCWFESRSYNKILVLNTSYRRIQEHKLNTVNDEFITTCNNNPFLNYNLMYYLW